MSDLAYHITSCGCGSVFCLSTGNNPPNLLELPALSVKHFCPIRVIRSAHVPPFLSGCHFIIISQNGFRLILPSFCKDCCSQTWTFYFSCVAVFKLRRLTNKNRGLWDNRWRYKCGWHSLDHLVFGKKSCWFVLNANAFAIMINANNKIHLGSRLWLHVNVRG